MGKGSWHEIGTSAVHVYNLAYLGDRGLVWEPENCLLLQQPWLDYTKLMGLRVSIRSLKMVKRMESVSQDLGQCKVKHASRRLHSHKKTNHKVSIKCAPCWQPFLCSHHTACAYWIRLSGSLVKLQPLAAVWLWASHLSLQTFVSSSIKRSEKELLTS